MRTCSPTKSQDVGGRLLSSKLQAIIQSSSLMARSAEPILECSSIWHGSMRVLWIASLEPISLSKITPKMSLARSVIKSLAWYSDQILHKIWNTPEDSAISSCVRRKACVKNVHNRRILIAISLKRPNSCHESCLKNSRTPSPITSAVVFPRGEERQVSWDDCASWQHRQESQDSLLLWNQELLERAWSMNELCLSFLIKPTFLHSRGHDARGP